MYQLENSVRPYAWGSMTAIAELFGQEPSGQPEAELWIGAHPDSPSKTLLPGGPEALDQLIAAAPEDLLGAEVHASFGGKLPFLMKVLAAASPLSLQVHPTVDQARQGFDHEESFGPARGAPNRNYKDANHKPEMIFALSRFEALCGFRPAAEAADVLDELQSAFTHSDRHIPELLTELIDVLRGPAPESVRLQGAFSRLIDGGGDVEALVASSGGVLANKNTGAFARELDTAVELTNQYPGDPGVLISLLLNRLSLEPGEAVYLPAGNVHAYLNGLGIEVMASSDNVLRGGLTPKHIDVPELMKTVCFEAAGIPQLQAEMTGLGQEVYRPPFGEFQLQRIEIPPGTASMAASDTAIVQNGPAIVLVTGGDIVLDSPQSDLRLGPGGSAFVPASEAPVMAKLASDTSTSGGALAFAVTVSTR